MDKKEVEPSPALMKALRDLDAVPVASRTVIHEEREALADENAALKRTVEDLAYALRKANAALEVTGAGASAALVRRTLERHGLLRDVDKPEMTQVFREEPAEHCNYCGALRGEDCDPDCEDRR